MLHGCSMMPLNWIKKIITGDERQIYGAELLVLGIACIYFLQMSLHVLCLPGNFSLPCSEITKTDSVIVEISGETNHKGIYFLSAERSTINDLFMAAGILKERKWDKELLNTNITSGNKVAVCGHYPYIKLENIDPKTRLALDLPVDINTANVEDLILIPGIGLKTAGKIIELREALNGFSKIEDLIKMSDFGTKKFNRTKDYLYIRDGV